MSKHLVLGRVVSTDKRLAKIKVPLSKLHRSEEVVEVFGNESLDIESGDYVLISSVTFRKIHSSQF